MRLITTTPHWTTTRRLNADLWREMDKFFDYGSVYASDSQAEATFNPSVDVSEDANHFLLSVDLPGLKKKDIKIAAADQKLTISGERKRETASSGQQVQRFEKSYGRFERSFSLPKNIDTDKIEANYEDGVLSLFLPKVEVAQPKKIEIQAGKAGFFEKLIGAKKADTTQAS